MTSEFPLHHIALKAARMLPRGAHAVAITGSLARGNWDANSDIDLWVLGKRNQRIHTLVDGAPVTYIVETVEEARSFFRMCMCDVLDAWILCDPRRELAAIKQRALQQRSRIERAITRATVDALLTAVEFSVGGNAIQRICGLREAAWRAAALHVWLAHGWRVPKLRHVESAVPRPAFRALKRALGLPLKPAAMAALRREWPRFIRAFSDGAPLHSVPHVLSEPRHVLRRPDAILDGRKALQAHLPTGVWLVLQRGMEPGPRLAPPNLGRVWAALNGFVPTEPTATATENAFMTLTRLLGTSRHFSTEKDVRRWRGAVQGR